MRMYVDGQAAVRPHLASLSLLFYPAGGATMVLFLQITFVFIGLLSCCSLAYGVQRLRHPDARLYWADLILASLFMLFITTLVLLTNVVGAADYWRIGVGCLGLAVIGYRLRHLHPRLWRDYKNWYRHALTDTALVDHLHHLAALVHWRA